MDNIKDQKINELLIEGRRGMEPDNHAALVEAQILMMRCLKLSIDSLRENIEKNNKINTCYTKWLIGLTVVITILTLIMAYPIISGS